MENRKFSISFISKEGNKATLSINSSWLIYTANAADFKKVMKEYFLPALNYADYDGNEKETDNISGYIAFMRECLETMQKADKTNKGISAKLKALETVKTGKTGKKTAVSDFEKASKTILKNAVKTCSNERTHTAFNDNGYIYVTDSYVAIRTNNSSLYNGYVSENSLNMEKIFTLKNDICKVFIPDIKTVKNNCSKGKNETYYITDDNTVYNVNYLYNAMLACSYNPDNCAAYKTENNNMSLLYIENTANNTSAVIMPIKPRETSFINAVADNKNSFISLNEYKSVIGITSLNKEEKTQDHKTENNSAAIIPEKEETAKTETNNNSVVMEYIKKHVVIPVSYETVMNMIQIQRSSECVSVSDNIIKNIKQFVIDLSAAYGELYVDMEKERKAYPYMVAAENFLKDPNNEKLLSAIINERGDLFTSDRELSALGLTLEKYNYAIGNYLSAVNIAGVDMFTSDAERLLKAKKYIVKAHSVYQIVPGKNGGYKGKRVYKTSKTHMPLVRSGRYITADRERVQYIINDSMPEYYSNTAVSVS